MCSFGEAKRLASALISVAKSEKVDATALLTRMDEPLGFKAGHDLEIEESADYLLGKSRERGLHEVVLGLASRMLLTSSSRKKLRFPKRKPSA